MKVILDRLLVRKSDPVQKIGSIILTDTAQGMNYNEGEVLNVGPGVWKDAGFVGPSIAVGDKIAWLKGQGIEVKIDGDDYTVIREQDVLFVK